MNPRVIFKHKIIPPPQYKKSSYTPEHIVRKRHATQFQGG